MKKIFRYISIWLKILMKLSKLEDQ
jgi:hypothetical protein